MVETGRSEPDPLASHGMPSAVASVCPWLGMTGDPATRYAFPSTAQVCHATRRPSDIAAAKQARDCLTTRHPSCSRYRAVKPAADARVATIALDPRHPAGSRLEGLPSWLAQLAFLAALTAVAIGAGYLIGVWLALAS